MEAATRLGAVEAAARGPTCGHQPERRAGVRADELGSELACEPAMPAETNEERADSTTSEPAGSYSPPRARPRETRGEKQLRKRVRVLCA